MGSPAVLLDQLSALTDPIRVRLLILLENNELNVRELQDVIQLPQSTVSRHLKVLADEGWLQLKRRRGATVIARNAPRVVDRREVDGLLRQLAQIAAQLRGAGMSSRQISSALRRIAQGARS